MACGAFVCSCMRIQGLIYFLMMFTERRQIRTNIVIAVSSFWRRKRKKPKFFLANTWEGDKCAFTPAHCASGRWHLLPASPPSCSLAAGAGGFLSSSNPLPSKHTKTNLCSLNQDRYFYLIWKDCSLVQKTQSTKMRGNHSHGLGKTRQVSRQRFPGCSLSVGEMMTLFILFFQIFLNVKNFSKLKFQS